MPHINLKAVTRVVGIVAIFNFIAFLALTVALGGEAGNGKIVDGHFLLSNYGEFIETSEASFRISLLLARGLLLTFGVTGLVGLASWIRDKFFQIDG